MSSVRQAGEPSVEEILESIKQVIARDNGGVPIGGPASAGGGTHAPGKAGSEDRQDSAEFDAGDEPDDVLELTETEPEVGRSGETSSADGLISERVRDSMRDSLNSLATLAEHGGNTMASPSHDNGIEALVRELLRPQLAAWLDRNLPGIVEELVAAEIARIVGRR